MNPSEGDVALACMRVLVSGLIEAGLEHACVSPGSRSTPIGLALHRDPRVRVHVHLDERSSAFFALGMAKATGKPVAVVCTSGTAAAEFFPAVVEASMSRVPLVLMTADRPPELRGIGANQTIDQQELYGRYAKRFVDAGVPASEPDAAGRWHALGVEVARASRAHPPGPVHLNLPFREPLVPTGAHVELGGFMFTPAPALSEPPLEAAPAAPAPADVAAIAGAIAGVERGTIVAGSLRQDAAPVLRLAEKLAWPLIAESTSGLRVPGAISAGQLLLGDEGFASEHVPDVVLQIGAAPVSRAGLAFVAAAERLLIIDPDELVADPARHASWTNAADPGSLAKSVLGRCEERAPSGWLGAWTQADAAVRSSVDGLIDRWDEPYEGRIARDLAAAIPDGGTLLVGSSMPVRDLDMYGLPRDGLRVLANRGASGIDGFVSTTLGVSASGAPTYALMGDLTLLHDGGGLLWNAGRGCDAVLVVLNNGGGSIFSFLAQRDLPEPELEELFTTPHALNLAKLADAAGAGHTRVGRAVDLVPAVENAADEGGVHVVEVSIDRELNVARHADVHAAVADVLADVAS